MDRRPFGPTGASLPVIGQGTWQMESASRPAAIAALRRGIELGMIHIDTAELYGSGRVEELVAEAITGRRDELYLVSKVMPSNATRRGTAEACERSLKRLRTDRLDCYLLHWPSQHPLEETIAAFEELHRDGKIRAWGVSNFDVRGLDAALAIAGPGRIACNQVPYHLGDRVIERAVIPWCEAQGVAVVGYSPFGAGRFPPRQGDFDTVSEIAEARRVSPRQIALAFLTRRPSLFAIPKASRPDHAAENAAAAEIRLTEEEIARLDRAFPLS